MSADDARTLSQRSEAEAALGRQAAAATSLERQRLRDETLAARTGPAGFRTAPVNPEASRPPGSKQSARVSTKVVKRAPAKAAKPRPPQAVRAG